MPLSSLDYSRLNLLEGVMQAKLHMGHYHSLLTSSCVFQDFNEKSIKGVCTTCDHQGIQAASTFEHLLGTHLL